MAAPRKRPCSICHRWFRPDPRVGCVFRSKWATDSGGKWATDSGGMWVQLSPVTGTLDSVAGTVDSVAGMVAQ